MLKRQVHLPLQRQVVTPGLHPPPQLLKKVRSSRILINIVINRKELLTLLSWDPARTSIAEKNVLFVPILGTQGFQDDIFIPVGNRKERLLKFKSTQVWDFDLLEKNDFNVMKFL